MFIYLVIQGTLQTPIQKCIRTLLVKSPIFQNQNNTNTSPMTKKTHTPSLPTSLKYRCYHQPIQTNTYNPNTSLEPRNLILINFFTRLSINFTSKKSATIPHTTTFEDSTLIAVNDKQYPDKFNAAEKYRLAIKTMQIIKQCSPA